MVTDQLVPAAGRGHYPCNTSPGTTAQHWLSIQHTRLELEACDYLRLTAPGYNYDQDQ